MALSYRIFPQRGLAFVSYGAHSSLDETLEVFARYRTDPDCRPGLKQLVDFGPLRSFAMDFPKLLETQARKAEVFLDGVGETLIVYHAPTRLARDLAHLVCRSWEPVPGVIATVTDREADALALTGQPETSFAELLATAS